MPVFLCYEQHLQIYRQDDIQRSEYTFHRDHLLLQQYDRSYLE